MRYLANRVYFINLGHSPWRRFVDFRLLRFRRKNVPIHWSINVITSGNSENKGLQIRKINVALNIKAKVCKLWLHLYSVRVANLIF